MNSITNHRKFTYSDLLLNVTDPQMDYHRRKDEEKTSIHWGQRKLLLTLIQFITNYWDPIKVPNPKLVYAGAAPGINIKIVSDLFPEMEFHLYDPAKFKIKASDKVQLYNQYFTDEDAKKWADKSDVYFVSDIRTADYTLAKDLDDNEKQIMGDMEMQMKWYKIIKPVKAHLKFRLPYTGGKRPPRVEYLHGIIYKQPWAPQTTTETRLVPDGDKMVSWCSQLYQDQMFYHNVIMREQYKYYNPFTETKEPIDKPELLNDWDSTTEAKIWEKYLIKRAGKSSQQLVVGLERMITQKLTEKSKYNDTINHLRQHPQYIKNRNFKPSRDNLDTHKITRDDSSRDSKSFYFHNKPSKQRGKLAKDIGLVE